MDAIVALPTDDADALHSETTQDEFSSDSIEHAAALVPDAPGAPESEYGRKDCLIDSERYRGKFQDLFERDCRPQTGGGRGSFAEFTNPESPSDTDQDDDQGGDDDPPPPPKPPEDADCSCSVPDFLAGYAFEVFGTAADDVLQGRSLDGGAGNDTLQGGDGNDVFFGNAGNDHLEPGNGQDSVNGGAGNDIVNGGPDNDVVIGGDGEDIVNGGPGNDTLCGDGGRDTLSGGEGNDCASGGAGNDLINGGTGNDTIHGDAGDDFLVGHDGDDVINGGSGRDFLRGDAGNDTLTGGAGEDLFYFGTETGDDVVRDFTRGADLLDMRGMGLTTWVAIVAHSQDTAQGILIAMGDNSVLLSGVHTVSSADFML